MPDFPRKLSILHIILAVRETSAPYNEHCLPWTGSRDISVCTYFPADIPTPENIRLYDGDGSLPGFFRGLRRAVSENTYDLVHVHSPHLGLLFLIASPFLGSKLTRSTVVTVHDSFQNYKFRNKLLFIPVFAGFQRVVCCSQASHDSFPGFFRQLAGSRLRVAPNGPDIERIDRIAAAHAAQRDRTAPFQVVAIGRMVPVKDPFTLLHSINMNASRVVRLVWIGDGVLRQGLVKKSQEARLDDCIQFTGLIPREQVFRHLLSSDLFISTSLGEGLPVSVLEAMACGLPVVLSDIPPHREIAQGVDFIPLVRTRDAAGFAREIKRFQDMSRMQRTAIGQQCRQLVMEQFSLSAMHARYADIYAEVTGAGPFLSAEILI